MVHQDETPLCRHAYTCSAATAPTLVDRTIKPPAKNCVDLRGRVSWRSLPVFDRRWGQASADGGTGVLPVPPYVGGLSAFSMRAGHGGGGLRAGADGGGGRIISPPRPHPGRPPP